MTNNQREAAVVLAADFGIEPDRGFMTSSIRIGNDSWSQGFGGLVLTTVSGQVWKDQLCALFRVSEFKDIVGLECFALRCWPGYNSPIEGLERNGRRFTITEFRRNAWPEKTWDPLAEKKDSLTADFHRLGQQSMKTLDALIHVADEYIDWTVWR